eukprot:777141-Heterocapsa_arctica.AAC.1
MCIRDSLSLSLALCPVCPSVCVPLSGKAFAGRRLHVSVLGSVRFASTVSGRGRLLVCDLGGR